MLFWSKKKYDGKQLGGYTIVRLIGKGRYGLCFLAKSQNGENVVIKKFRPGIYKKNADKNAYEAVILSKLSDKRIPELLGVINQKKFYCFILEYKQGHTLKDLLFKDNCKFTPRECYDIGGKLIKIIIYLHENGVVHRDIRIPNVLLDREEVYLIDFGLARWADGSQYPFNLDFSYLGDLLLYLLYSSYDRPAKKKLPWYKELPLTDDQKRFLKKLLGLDIVYTNIYDVHSDFVSAFMPRT